jgi:hypothetical protein
MPSLSPAAVSAATCSLDAEDAAASKEGVGLSAPPDRLLAPAPLKLVLLLLLEGPVLLVRGLVAALLPRLLPVLLLIVPASSAGRAGCGLWVWKILGSGKHFLHHPSCRQIGAQVGVRPGLGVESAST